MWTALFVLLTGIALVEGYAIPAQAENSTVPDSHGWIGSETVKTRFGAFEFKNGYPTPAAAEGLLDQLKLNRAIEVYLTQMMPVSQIALREGL